MAINKIILPQNANDLPAAIQAALDKLVVDLNRQLANDFDAKNQRIINVSSPVSLNDAVNLKTLRNETNAVRKEILAIPRASTYTQPKPLVAIPAATNEPAFVVRALTSQTENLVTVRDDLDVEIAYIGPTGRGKFRDIEVASTATLSTSTANGPFKFAALTASRPLKLTSGGTATATQIDLASSNDISGVLSVARGGTDGTNASTARENLGLGTASSVTLGTLTLSNLGTNQLVITGSGQTLISGNITLTTSTLNYKDHSGTNQTMIVVTGVSFA